MSTLANLNSQITAKLSPQGVGDKVTSTELRFVVALISALFKERGVVMLAATTDLANTPSTETTMTYVDNEGLFKYYATGTPDNVDIFPAQDGGVWKRIVAGGGGGGPIDPDLVQIGNLTPANNDIIQRIAGAWVNRTMAQLKTALALVKGDVGLGSVPNVDATNPNNIVETITKRFVSDAEKTSWNNKADLNSPNFTGAPKVPTAAPGTNDTTAASTGFVKALFDLAEIVFDSNDFAGLGTALDNLRIANNAITNAKLGTDVKVGSLSALLTTNKTSAVAAINEIFGLGGGGGSSDYKLIDSGTFAGVLFKNFDVSATSPAYKSFIIEVYDLVFTVNPTTLALRTTANFAGGVYDGAGTDYSYMYDVGPADVNDGFDGDPSIVIATGIYGPSTKAGSVTIKIQNPAGTTLSKAIMFDVLAQGEFGAVKCNRGGGWRNNTAVVQGIRLFADNNMSGSYKIYGRL